MILTSENTHNITHTRKMNDLMSHMQNNCQQKWHE